MNQVSNRLTKASFSGCSAACRREFPKSKCLLSISVGQLAHEGGKFDSTIKLINRNFRSCVILVGDTLQRYNLALRFKEEPQLALYKTSLQRGDDWLSRNEIIYNELAIPFEVIRWDKWLKHLDFPQMLARVKAWYRNSDYYRDSINKCVLMFLSRNEAQDKKDPFVLSICRDYLFEECAVMCLWLELSCQFEVYPSARNAAMEATYNCLIKDKHPNLLRPVSLRFRKAKAMSHCQNDA